MPRGMKRRSLHRAVFLAAAGYNVLWGLYDAWPYYRRTFAPAPPGGEPVVSPPPPAGG
jgi:hypothetical protein